MRMQGMHACQLRGWRAGALSRERASARLTGRTHHHGLVDSEDFVGRRHDLADGVHLLDRQDLGVQRLDRLREKPSQKVNKRRAPNTTRLHATRAYIDEHVEVLFPVEHDGQRVEALVVEHAHFAALGADVASALGCGTRMKQKLSMSGPAWHRRSPHHLPPARTA